tara:strand:+ start:79 stop:774 length:696 start_codon:yes stop_codon:yes gene_type:complete
MAGSVGNITTDIIKKGLVFNFDAANRASTIPSTSTDKTFNTIDLSQSGSFTADAQFDSSTISPSFNLDGTGDYINLGNDSILNFSKYTFSVWVKLSNTNNQTFIGKGLSKNYGFGISVGNIYHNIKTSAGWGGNESTSVSGNISTDTWQNVVGTYDEVNIKVYVDGEFKSSLAKAGPIVYSSSNTEIGHIGDDYNGYYVTGNMGPIQIYNRALSASEILHNYNALKGRFGL